MKQKFDQKEVIDYMNELAYKIKRGEVSDVVISYADKGGVAAYTCGSPAKMMFMLMALSQNMKKGLKRLEDEADNN